MQPTGWCRQVLGSDRSAREDTLVRKAKKKQKVVKGELSAADLAKVTGGGGYGVGLFFKRWGIYRVTDSAQV